MRETCDTTRVPPIPCATAHERQFGQLRVEGSHTGGVQPGDRISVGLPPEPHDRLRVV